MWRLVHKLNNTRYDDGKKKKKLNDNRPPIDLSMKNDCS